MILKLIVKTFISIFILGLLLFVAAGTVFWPAAWIFLLIQTVGNLSIGLWLANYDPELLAGRLNPAFPTKQEKILELLLFVFTGFWLIIMGIEVKRFPVIEMPQYMQIVGIILLLFSQCLAYLVFKVNSFASVTARIQKERGHKLIREGLYAYVRHPLYSVAILFYVGSALLLGSIYGLLLVWVFIILVNLQAKLEEKILAKEFADYGEYAKQVRYRFIPYIL